MTSKSSIPSTIPVSFPTLPVELIELIAEFCDRDILLDLRLVCRELQEKTFHHFAHRFFSSIKTDLSSHSLRRINQLSKHVTLRPYVHNLAFMLQTEMGAELIWPRHPWGPLSAPLKVDAVRTLRDDLIHNLKSCRSFFIFCRYPEGRPKITYVTITDAVAVFFALVVDGLPVQSFHLIYANKFSRTLIMDMRRLPKLLYRKPEFQSAWSNLQKLSLEQYLTLENFSFLLELVLSAPNLQTLLLNLGSHGLAYEFLHELAEAGTLSQLQELALFRTAVRAADLQKLLGSLRESLITLTLYNVSLAPEDHWKSVLNELGCDFLGLETVSFHYLWAYTPAKGLLAFPNLDNAAGVCDSPGQRLSLFYSESKVPTILGIEYSGSKMSQILGLLQAATGAVE